MKNHEHNKKNLFQKSVADADWLKSSWKKIIMEDVSMGWC